MAEIIDLNGGGNTPPNNEVAEDVDVTQAFLEAVSESVKTVSMYADMFLRVQPGTTVEVGKFEDSDIEYHVLVMVKKKSRIITLN